MRRVFAAHHSGLRVIVHPVQSESSLEEILEKEHENSSTSLRRPVINTGSIPSSTKCFAVARPIPVEPPVITANFPASLLLFILLTSASCCIASRLPASRLERLGSIVEPIVAPLFI